MIFKWFTADPTDREYPTDKPVYIVWAIGRLDTNHEPTFHDIYHKSNIQVNLGRSEPESNCFSFTRSDTMLRPPWEKGQIFDRNIRTFKAYLGPSGGKRGYQGITGKHVHKCRIHCTRNYFSESGVITLNSY